MQTQVKEHPILFNEAMVRALLTGTKTQTRRALKIMPRNSPGCSPYCADNGKYFLFPVSTEDFKKLPKAMQQDQRSEGGYYYGPCPNGQPGDRLWVRENFRYVTTNAGTADARYDVQYAADNAFGGLGKDHPQWLEAAVARNNWKGLGSELEYQSGKPSIHMPRAASRILLEITAVRCEGLLDISESDAVAEGISVFQDGKGGYALPIHNCDNMHYRTHEPIRCYRALWNQIYGEGSFDANPWVWVVEFQRVEA